MSGDLMNIFYIDLGNVDYIKKYGYLGLAVSILKDENIYFSNIGKYADEVDDNFLIDYVKDNIDMYKNKLLHIEEFQIPGYLIDEEVEKVINSLSTSKKIYITEYFTNPEIIKELCNSDNVFLMGIYYNRLNLEQLKTLFELKNKGKLLVKKYDVEKYKDVLVKVNEPLNILVYVDNFDDVKKNMMSIGTNEMSNISGFIINACDIHDIRAIDSFCYDYIEKYTNPITLVLNIDVKSVGIDKFPKINENYYYDTIKVKVNAYDEKFDSYTEFKIFNDLMNFLNGKIPKEATELEKTIFISNFIVNFLDYDYLTKGNKNIKTDGERCNTSFSNVIYNGDGVCRHYAEVAKCIFNYFDIECEYIGSRSKDSLSSPGHAFNLIHLDNKIYWLDLTWADFGVNGIADDINFLVSSKTFDRTHHEYIEIDRYYCEEDYDRNEIRKAISNIINWNTEMTIDDINYLQSKGLGVLSNKSEALDFRQYIENNHLI